MRGGEVARRLKRSISSVRSRRNEATSIRFIRTPKRWTPSELRLLGRLPDGEIARRTGRFLASVWNKRIQLGILKSLFFPTPTNTNNTVKYGCVCGNFLW